MAKKAAARYNGKIDRAGRVVIPVKIRERLGMKPGAAVTITAGSDGRIVLEPRASLLRAAQDYFRSLAPESEVWSDELIQERRREAQREIED